MSQSARYINWADMAPGHVLEPFVWRVGPQEMSAYVEAVEDGAVAGVRIVGERAASGSPVAPPMLAAVYCLRSFVPDGLELPPGGIHLRQRFDFHAVVLAGDTLTTTATVEQCRPRGDKIWVTLSTNTVNQDGIQVATSRFTGVWPREG
ncbi:MAG: hypothetical protein EPO21_10125 [Chloroflexota bacterium]|nr:MAG: hypothetical protein EPO21_10125 [Chloroflexota bacterium]